ncbi:MAG: hypothetical protein R3F39_10640, partial [Myxococcota bacterium]
MRRVNLRLAGLCLAALGTVAACSSGGTIGGTDATAEVTLDAVADALPPDAAAEVNAAEPDADAVAEVT